MATSLAEAILQGAHDLRRAGVPEARREAGSLLAHILGRDRTFILSHADDPISDEQLEKFYAGLAARASRKPLQYITGHQEFYGLDFEVNEDVLIPRPETELLIELALKAIAKSNVAPLICDVGTGSGCIAITLLHELPQARVVAIDVSTPALAVAERNATRHAVIERVELIVSDCFAEMDPGGTVFDLIVSNPPYVAEGAFAGLQREVRDFEPRTALMAGPDGLAVIRRLLKEAPDFLKPGGQFLFEIGFDQRAALEGLLEQPGARDAWKLLDIHPDLQGIPRIVALQRQA
ncbi:MAG: peptide chain release factor N(5)-glutamine methyltransferase [Acidobacteriota bacterium]|nr:peptide chain release factor N(5)-glutamine methyltransferase [Acidobacteriota bacterium]